MSQVEVRRITGPELLDVSILLRGYAFWPSPSSQPRIDLESEVNDNSDNTNLALFEDGLPMAVVGYIPLTQHVRGQIVKSAGVGGVATHPAGRRKGYARQALQELFKAMRQEEMSFTVLYPFRESFYERLGYTTFPRPRKVRFPVNALTGLLKLNFGGKVELLTYQEGFSQWRAYLAQQQAHIPGMALVSDIVADHQVKLQKYWLAAAKVDGETVGMMRYELKGDRGDMVVSRFYYHTAQGLYLLLDWIARHADQATTVELKLPPGELPETWLADLDIQLGVFDAPMSRVLDVGRLDGLGLQAGPGRFSARILDPYCPWNEGIYTFEGKDGQLRVSQGGQAGCELSIQALSGLISGTHRPEVFPLRGWGNPGPDTQETMARMFPPQLPYLHEVF